MRKKDLTAYSFQDKYALEGALSVVTHVPEKRFGDELNISLKGNFSCFIFFCLGPKVMDFKWIYLTFSFPTILLLLDLKTKKLVFNFKFQNTNFI